MAAWIPIIMCSEKRDKSIKTIAFAIVFFFEAVTIPPLTDREQYDKIFLYFYHSEERHEILF